MGIEIRKKTSRFEGLFLFSIAPDLLGFVYGFAPPDVSLKELIGKNFIFSSLGGR